MSELLTRVSFEPHLNTAFAVAANDSITVDVELVEVTDKTPAGFGGEQFSLIFSGPLDPALPQRLYEMQHAGMGKIQLFLVPVGIRNDRRQYEAFFNRFDPDEA